MQNGMFTLNLGSVGKGLVIAVLSGAFLAVDAIFQTPNFSVATANWHAILVLAENGGLVGFSSYVVKEFFSTSDGKVFGKLG